MEPIILASSSPQRQDFFNLLGLPFTVMPASIDETMEEELDAGSAVSQLALKKVKKVLSAIKGDFTPWICGADTVISLEGKIYGKPRDREDAGRMLRSFQGKTHKVISAVALYSGKSGVFDCRTVLSSVSFARLSEGEIEWYLDSQEWRDAAGAYKIQGLASCFISGIEGSYSSIVGLPLREFYVMLRDNGYPYGSQLSFTLAGEVI
jgi:septum formation protein